MHTDCLFTCDAFNGHHKAVTWRVQHTVLIQWGTAHCVDSMGNSPDVSSASHTRAFTGEMLAWHARLHCAPHTLAFTGDTFYMAELK